jgi:Uma2 family endonuclease
MAARPSIRFKADDIWDTPEDGNRYEVIDGKLYVTPPPVPQHQSGATELAGFLVPHVRERLRARRDVRTGDDLPPRALPGTRSSYRPALDVAVRGAL